MIYLKNFYKIAKKDLGKGIKYIYKLCLYGIITKIFHFDTDQQIQQLYGNFKLKEKYESFSIFNGIGNDTDFIPGGAVKFIQNIKNECCNALLTGENSNSKKIFSQLLQMDETMVKTAGIDKDADYSWDFESDPPSNMDKYDLIVSISMLEHILNPYKHVQDLTKLLNPNKYLFIQTCLPVQGYHRYPIDCCRFFPDWFEEIAKRLNLQVIDKHMHTSSIYYLYKKQEIL